MPLVVYSKFHTCMRHKQLELELEPLEREEVSGKEVCESVDARKQQQQQQQQKRQQQHNRNSFFCFVECKFSTLIDFLMFSNRQ